MEAIVRPFGDKSPRIDSSAFIAPGAVVIGDVSVGPQSSIWYGCVLRGDVNFIRVGERVNIQDGSILHVNRDVDPTIVEDDVTLGHGAVVHACTVRRGALIGIRATVLDGAEVGEGALIGAGSVVAPRAKIPPGTLALGIPAKPRRELRPDELAHMRETVANYVALAAAHRALF